MKKDHYLHGIKYIACIFFISLAVFAVCDIAHAESKDSMASRILAAIHSGASEVNLTVDCTVTSNIDELASQVAAIRKNTIVPLFKQTVQDRGLDYRGTIGCSIVPGGYKLGGDSITINVSFTRGDLVKGQALASEKQAYRVAVLAYKYADTETTFYPADGKTDYTDIFYQALYQHTEYYYNAPVYWSDGSIKLEENAFTAKKQKTYIEKAEKKAVEIVKKVIKKGMTKKEKIKVLHDYLATHCEYDMNSYGAGKVTMAHTAYGALIKKKAVCQGYSAAFNLLLNKAGINSISVAGEANGGSHSWNMLMLGDTCYYYDVTYDDPVHSGGPKPDYVRWKYFGLTSKELSKTHSWVKVEYAPKYLTYSSFLVQ